MHENTILTFRKKVVEYIQPGMRILEVGPDQFPSSLINEINVDDIIWETIDITGDYSLSYHAIDEYTYPIMRESFDMIISTNVIEHIRDPWKWMNELYRILKIQGILAIITPVSWDYHACPYDCWRIYPEALKMLFRKSSFDVLHCDWGSYESPGYSSYRQGISVDSQTGIRKFTSNFMKIFGGPVERAYDTVGIATKT